MLENFTVNHYQFTLKALESCRLPGFKGSMLRGAFGYAFRRVTCALRDKDCPTCFLRSQCIYAYVFETPPPAGTAVLKGYQRAPNPFIIEPPEQLQRDYHTGDDLHFTLILIGRANNYLPHFVYAFEEACRSGLGRDESPFTLERVTYRGELLYSPGCKKMNIPAAEPVDLQSTGKVAQVSLELLTPMRIVREGRLTRDISFSLFIRTLVWRISLLSCFHCDGQIQDFDSLQDRAKDIRIVHDDLVLRHLERLSTRQKKRLELCGMQGKITFAGDLDEFLPLIKLGEIIHVGKNATFGLGRYRMEVS